jgi:hypothetical protein
VPTAELSEVIGHDISCSHSRMAGATPRARDRVGLSTALTGDQYHSFRSFIVAARLHIASSGFLVQADDPRCRR